mgnify:CR=1 FL=1
MEIQKLLEEHNIDPIVKDVPQDNWWLTELLPLIMLIVVVVFMFSMMSAQNAGNSGGGKMMNMTRILYLSALAHWDVFQRLRLPPAPIGRLIPLWYKIPPFP